MADNTPTDTTDVDGIFDVDFTAPSGNPEKAPPPTHTPSQKTPDDKTNPYEGVEDVLGLPRGSTKEGLAAARQEVKRITDEAKTLKMKAKIAVEKEKLSGDDLLPGFSIESLAADRRALRDNYMQLYGRGLKVLDRIEKDLEDLVNPEPDDYANYQRQYLAILKTLDSIKASLVMLREEEERHQQKTAAAVPAGISAENPDGTPVSGGGAVGEGKIEVAPQDTNSWIAKWTAEMEEDMKQSIQDDFDARHVPKQIGQETEEKEE